MSELENRWKKNPRYAMWLKTLKEVKKADFVERMIRLTFSHRDPNDPSIFWFCLNESCECYECLNNFCNDEFCCFFQQAIDMNEIEVE